MRRPAGLILLPFLLLCLAAGAAAQSFSTSNLDFAGLGSVSSSTSLEFGPDGRLYVLQIDGTLDVFTIQRNGEVTGIILEGPSGCYPLDDSALDALREVILPPLPKDFPRDQETVHARFIAATLANLLLVQKPTSLSSTRGIRQ